MNFELDMNINGENPKSKAATSESLTTTSEKGFSKYRIAQESNFVNRLQTRTRHHECWQARTFLRMSVSLCKTKWTEGCKQGTTGNGVAQNSHSVDISIAVLFAFVKQFDAVFSAAPEASEMFLNARKCQRFPCKFRNRN